MHHPLAVTLLLVLLVLASVAVLLWAPVSVSFLLALVSAVAWCIWLERHPAT
jgi:hypothetical protein